MHAQNLYLYANANPVNATDPTGRFVCPGTPERVIEAVGYGHLPNFGTLIKGTGTLLSGSISVAAGGAFFSPVTLTLIGVSAAATAVDIGCGVLG